MATGMIHGAGSVTQHDRGGWGLGLRPEAWRTVGIVLAVLVLSVVAGRFASFRLLAVPLAALLAVLVAGRPHLGIVALIFVALFGPVAIGTGTQVELNLSVLLLPFLIALLVLRWLVTRRLPALASRPILPLLLFVASSMVSLIAGNAFWSLQVPRPPNLLLVQLAQWAIFALSAGVFLLAGSVLVELDEKGQPGIQVLERITIIFLLLAAPLAAARCAQDFWWQTGAKIGTAAVEAGPFWVCLAGLAGGQLLFNKDLSRRGRCLLILILGAILAYSSILHEERVSHWMGVITVAGVLVLLRLRRGRVLAIVAVLVLLAAAYPLLYDFLGGDTKWEVSGASRILLIERVVRLASRNPILGLGPASYRQYGLLEPLQYGNARWVEPQISSHNNYVDIYAQTGIVGLVLFFWFLVETGLVAWRLRRVYRQGFAAGYVNGMLATLAGSVVIMFFLDWLMPFVYDVGFRGFQASLLVWLFLGGLVYLDGAARRAGVQAPAS